MDAVLQAMFDELQRGNTVYLPSKFWEEHNAKNIQQLESGGLDNIKQTVAQSYFTWLVSYKDVQFWFLVRHTQLRAWPSVLSNVLAYDPTSSLSRPQQRDLRALTLMVWKYAERFDSEHILARIDEPKQGNPLKIYIHDKLASQDLANSVLEYYSIREYFNVSPSDSKTICELGAGYGRNAFVFLSALPKCKYIIVDIPPALYISQHYLSSVFRNMKIFKFRPFQSFSDIEKEFNEANLVFLLPHQAEMLPAKRVDLFINISSLHEMKRDQIQAYFTLIDKLTKGFFYSKQWWESRNAADGITITSKDYPVPKTWKQLYFRAARVQTYFFEAMYELSDN